MCKSMSRALQGDSKQAGLSLGSFLIALHHHIFYIALPHVFVLWYMGGHFTEWTSQMIGVTAMPCCEG